MDIYLKTSLLNIVDGLITKLSVEACELYDLEFEDKILAKYEQDRVKYLRTRLKELREIREGLNSIKAKPWE